MLLPVKVLNVSGKRHWAFILKHEHSLQEHYPGLCWYTETWLDPQLAWWGHEGSLQLPGCCVVVAAVHSRLLHYSPQWRGHFVMPSVMHVPDRRLWTPARGDCGKGKGIVEYYICELFTFYLIFKSINSADGCSQSGYVRSSFMGRSVVFWWPCFCWLNFSQPDACEMPRCILKSNEKHSTEK